MIRVTPWVDYKKRIGDIPSNFFKPGMVIEVKIINSTKKKKEVFLVGDINKLGGICDNCRMFTDNDIITRYRFIEGWK